MKKPSGRDAHLAEMKFAVNSTARARKSLYHTAFSVQKMPACEQ